MNYQVAMLYIATFGRAPDASGLEYWVYESNLDIEGIAQSFFDQKETQDIYPAGTSNDVFITSVYNNLFDRDPDIDGLNYWKDELDSGNISKSHFILAVMNGALGDDATLLANKTEVGLAFVDDGLNDVELAYSVIDKVTVDTQSVVDAIEMLDIVSNPTTATDDAYAKFSYTDNDLGEISNFNTYGVEQLDSGYRWDEDLTEITYSFNTTLPYEYSDEDSQDWEELNDSQKSAVVGIMDGLSDLLGVTFVQSDANSGLIRFNVVDMDEEWAGYAYYPGDYSVDGDVFLSQIFNSDENYFDLSAGSVAWDAIAHEIGHALGLKHPFDGYSTLPDSLDDTDHTIMSYTDRGDYVPVFTLDANSINVSYTLLAPELYSLYDVAALQAIYGVNEDTNIGNDVYTQHYTDYKIYTIWDAGGVDTIDLSDNLGHDIIDMHAGTINSADYYTLDETITLYQDEVDDSYFDDWISDIVVDLYSDQQLYQGENNLSIATGVVIENLYTGSNSDTVVDNEVDNYISTGGGDDEIYLGSGGYDYVDGGDGYDTIVFKDISSANLDVITLGEGSYLLIGDKFAAEIVGVEEIYFSEEDSGFSPDDLVV